MSFYLTPRFWPYCCDPKVPLHTWANDTVMCPVCHQLYDRTSVEAAINEAKESAPS